MTQEDLFSFYHRWRAGDLTDANMAWRFFLYAYQCERPKTIYPSLDPSLLDHFQFKKVKGKALYCLRQWLQGSWPLVLVDRILTPYEVLAYQARGERPVTMLIDNLLSPVLHRRNALDFFCHDLEHGYMFFSNQELYEMQKKFFSRILESLKTDLWNDCLSDKSKRSDFYYLISDMNTHEAHYKAFLGHLIPKNDFAKFEKLFL